MSNPKNGIHFHLKKRKYIFLVFLLLFLCWLSFHLAKCFSYKVVLSFFICCTIPKKVLTSIHNPGLVIYLSTFQAVSSCLFFSSWSMGGVKNYQLWHSSTEVSVWNFGFGQKTFKSNSAKMCLSRIILWSQILFTLTTTFNFENFRLYFSVFYLHKADSEHQLSWQKIKIIYVTTLPIL